MAKRHLLMLGLLLGGGALSSAACSDTKIVTIGDGDAGEAGDTGSHAGSGNAGSGHAGAGNGGSGGDAGFADLGGASGEGGAGGEGDEPPYDFPSSLNPQAVVVVGPEPSTSTTLLVAGTDYKTTEIVSVTIGSGAIGDSATYGGDTVATSSAGVGFAIERGSDKVHLLNGGKISATFDLKDLGTDKTVLDQKAYVPVLNQSLIVVLDLAEGKVSHRIDLNAYNAPADSDHSADIADGVYDPNSKIAYFLLQRIDINSIFADPKYQLHCPAYRGLIVGIDTKTDEVVDLNGDAEGNAIELELVNPGSLSINADGSALYLLANGCFDGDTKIHQGVEVIDPTAGTTTVAYAATGNDYLSRLIRTNSVGDALLESSDDLGVTHWHKLDLAAGTLGAELANVPKAPSFDGTDLLGVEVTGKVGKVVRYKVATATSTPISATSWAGEYGTASSTALVQ